MDAPAKTEDEILADQTRVLADLYTVPGLKTVLSSVRTYRRGPHEAQVYGEPCEEGRAMRVVRDLLDEPVVEVVNNEDEAASIHVHLDGNFNGVPLQMVSVIRDQGARDIIRDLPVDRVIDALAGDPPAAISESTVREVTTLAVYDRHEIGVAASANRLEAQCTCGWVSEDAFAGEVKAMNAGYEHRAEVLAKELASVGIGSSIELGEG